jgi:hypothetical protein
VTLFISWPAATFQSAEDALNKGGASIDIILRIESWNVERIPTSEGN